MRSWRPTHGTPRCAARLIGRPERSLRSHQCIICALSGWPNAKQVAQRRGAQIAIMALARKLSHVLYAMWKYETIDDSARSARVLAA